MGGQGSQFMKHRVLQLSDLLTWKFLYGILAIVTYYKGGEMQKLNTFKTLLESFVPNCVITIGAYDKNATEDEGVYPIEARCGGLVSKLFLGSDLLERPQDAAETTARLIKDAITVEVAGLPK